MNLALACRGRAHVHGSVASMTIAAKYEEGVFKPLEEVTIKEGTVVEVRLPSVRRPPKGQIPLCSRFRVLRHMEGPCRHRR